MKKILFMIAILALSSTIQARGFDFEGYKKQKYTLPPLPKMDSFTEYEGFLWEPSLNENGEFTVVIGGIKHTLAKVDTYALQKFLNDNLPEPPKVMYTNKARILILHQQVGKKPIVVEEKFFNNDETKGSEPVAK